MSRKVIAKNAAVKDGKQCEFRVVRDSEWNEYIVKYYIDGKEQIEWSYHTDDKQDAIDTANSWFKPTV